MSTRFASSPEWLARMRVLRVSGSLGFMLGFRLIVPIGPTSYSLVVPLVGVVVVGVVAGTAPAEPRGDMGTAAQGDGARWPFILPAREVMALMRWPAFTWELG